MVAEIRTGSFAGLPVEAPAPAAAAAAAQAG